MAEWFERMDAHDREKEREEEESRRMRLWDPREDLAEERRSMEKEDVRKRKREDEALEALLE